ncbi:hypothetical protein A1O3_08116 [Capronia epimyces CBS 606.96]|uniref:Major facilitator superfamily (MFS) profile domain-containing protein n=1 Tax=Capronia epimyces CBS 606.96 TaxID=1182542 RepID=W9XS89_9EURO|nr:uncharacterized protein A1O3_08116 [Capronia epimyces CBS 606.96]EXJ79831.1 hypothetical protein A1O3_08116 [Capronia epimyces CBS 606.96]
MADEQPLARRSSVLKSVFVCLFIMSGSLLFGIDSGEIGGFMAMESFLKDFGYYDQATQAYNIAAHIQLALNGMLFTGCILASISAGYIGTKYGRRVGLFCTGLVSIIGVVFQVSSAHLGTLYVGRIFTGAGVGFASNFVPTYNAEVSPTHLRGMMIGLYQTGVNIGQVIGTCINEGTHNMSSRWAYRIPLMTQLFFPIVLCSFVWLFPETPRWLLSTNKHEAAARAVRRLRGKSYPQDQITEDIDEIAKHIEAERLLESSGSLFDIFRGSDLRRTHIACGTVVWQVLSGISFINGYGTYFFTVSGISSPFVISIISQVCQLAGLILMFPSLQYMGRRTILLWGGAGQTVCMFLFAIVGTAAPGSVAAARCLVAFTCLYGFFFTWSWGPVGWIVTSEVASNTLRSKTQGLASAASWLGTLVVSLSVPYLINTDEANLGAKVGFIFGALCLLGFLWAYRYLPETKGRSLEELDELFMNVS